MLNLSEDAQEGLKKLSRDLFFISNKVLIERKQRSLIDLIKLTFAVSFSVIVLYVGLLMVVDYTLLFGNIPAIVVLLIVCAAGLGLFSNVKKDD